MPKDPPLVDNLKTLVGDLKRKQVKNRKLTKNVSSSLVIKPQEITKRNKYFEGWKQNAWTIFENSDVYPFIHAGTKYKCFVCYTIFQDPLVLKCHTENEHNIQDVKRKLKIRIRDENIKVDVNSLQCRLCLQTLPDLQKLKTHLKDHGKDINPELQDNVIPFKLGDVGYNCQICGESHNRFRLLVIHMSKHFNNYSCEICGAVFISAILLKSHQRSHESGAFPCDKCDKAFPSLDKRTKHIKAVHLKQFPRKCPMCPERFNSEYQKTKHLRLVHNKSEGMHKCETCGREYDLRYHLLIHIRKVHLQEKNQECPICHFRFFSKYCLTRHMVTHTGEKNFICGLCGKAYARRKTLTEHMKSHQRDE